MRQLFRPGAMLLLAATVPVTLGGTLSDQTQADQKDRNTFEQTVALEPGSSVTVRNRNGSIDVRAWDRAEVAIVAVKTAQSSIWRRGEVDLSEVEIEVSESPEGVAVRTIVPHGIRNVSVSYDLRVPSSVDLELFTANGSVSVEDVAGRVIVRSSNGRINADNISGPVDLETTNGSIDAELREVTDADMRFETVNGSVTVAVPHDAAASVDARTTNGSIRSDLPVVMTGTMRKRHLSGDLNGGGAKLDIKTVNGSVRVRES